MENDDDLEGAVSGEGLGMTGPPTIAERFWDQHLPVVAVRESADGKVDTPKPYFYGTAFPIAAGLFLTAAHVIEQAGADGELALSLIRGPGQHFEPFEVSGTEVFPGLDLGLIQCRRLNHLPAMRCDFDRRLDMLAPCSAVGFPMAVDPEWVSCVARAFGGFVITRREMFQLAAQPAGYELSFFAPSGLSGAPLIAVNGDEQKPYCYGWIVQQSTIGAGHEKTPVGIAVGIETLLGVPSKLVGADLATVFGRSYVPPAPRSAKQLPGGMAPTNTDPNVDWPDED